MIASIQTYGDDPTRYHPHLHCLVADGLILPDGSFLPIPRPDPVQIMLLFRHKLLKTLLAKEKISQRLVDILLSWRHPGFSVFQGDSVSPDDLEARERLARILSIPPLLWIACTMTGKLIRSPMLQRIMCPAPAPILLDPPPVPPSISSPPFALTSPTPASS